MPVKNRGELQMKKRLFLLLAVSGVCFCTQGADVKTAPVEALSAETPPPETEVIPSDRRSGPARKLQVLTDSRNNFRYAPLRVIDPRPVAQQFRYVCHGAKNLEKAADQLFSGEGTFTIWPHFREWGILYANLPRLTGRPDVIPTETAKYALALLCDERYNEAEQILRELAEKNPDDYGTMILLGAFSVRNKEYFPYLEKAFAADPTRSVNFIVWQCQNLDLLQKLPEEWDFAGSFLPLLLQYREQIDLNAIPAPALLRLNKAIREKYFGEDHRIRPEYRDQKEKWSSLCTTLVKHMD